MLLQPVVIDALIQDLTKNIVQLFMILNQVRNDGTILITSARFFQSLT